MEERKEIITAQDKTIIQRHTLPVPALSPPLLAAPNEPAVLSERPFWGWTCIASQRRGWDHTPLCVHPQGFSLPLVFGHVEGHLISLVDFTLVIHVCECIRHKEVLLQGPW